MHPYVQKLHDESKRKSSLLCFGMDPVIERMKIDQSRNLSDEIVRYFGNILHEIVGKVSAIKPNVGYYLQYGNEGMKALSDLITHAKSLGLLVIIDAKIGDIGRTSVAYAKFFFEVLNGDAVTLNPYMGYDALEPFFTYKQKGFYILALTSNPGAKTFQLEKMQRQAFLYEYVLQTICGWNRSCASIGAVIGATQEAFKACINRLSKSHCSLPLLIPGVGAQGGSYGKIGTILGEEGWDTGSVRINASSSISYAWERFPSYTVEEASRRAVEEILKS